MKTTDIYKTHQYIVTRALPAFEYDGSTLPRLFNLNVKTALEAVEAIKAWEKSWSKFTYEVHEVRQYSLTNDVHIFSVPTEDLLSRAKDELEVKLNEVYAKIEGLDNKTIMLDLEKKAT
jgi:hypothetical protein